jgi:hypothetical protein
MANEVGWNVFLGMALAALGPFSSITSSGPTTWLLARRGWFPDICHKPHGDTQCFAACLIGEVMVE